MSIDRNGSCFNCKIVKDNLKKEIDDTYGKIPQGAYNTLIATHSNYREPFGHTLEESYEFYITDKGILEIDYSCECKKCGFTFKLNETKDMKK